jgi:hypothetical protein
MSKSMESLKLINYRGNCHCGAFKFTLKAPELKQAFACNCSICSRVRSIHSRRIFLVNSLNPLKNGYMWVFPESSDHFTVVKGTEDITLKNYEFGKRTTTHKVSPLPRTICETGV